MKKTIYKITHKETQKCYIGQTIDFDRRKSEHQRLSGSNTVSLIGRAINKYGVDAFDYEILEETEDFNEREVYWIKYYSSLHPDGYNLTEGGESPPIGRGENNPFAKITQETADEIIKDLLEFKMEKRDIITKYNVSPDIVRHINDGDSWRKDNLTYPLRGTEGPLIQMRVDRIKDLLRNTKMTQKEIAAEVGRARSTITAINNGQNFYDPSIDYPIRKKNRQQRPVYAVDMTTEEISLEFGSVQEAADTFSPSKSNTAISLSLSRPYERSAYGYYWFYQD